MKQTELRQRILCVTSKKEAESLLHELRGAGHQVSVVEDSEEAAQILDRADFDFALMRAAQLSSLLETQALWDRSGHDEWRRSVAAIAHDLRNLLHAFHRYADEGAAPHLPLSSSSLENGVKVGRALVSLSLFLEEVLEELECAPASARPAVQVETEEIAEAAAMAAYGIAVERGPRLSIHIDESVRSLRTHPAALKRLLANLLMVVAERASASEIVRLEAHEDDGECVFQISLSGGTVSGARLRQLVSSPAEPSTGSRTSSWGEREAVERLGGRVWFESESTGETSIYLALPLR